MSVDPVDLVEGLAANLSTIEGFQKSAFLLANPTPPAVEIEPLPTEYDKTFQRGLDQWMFLVRVFVGLTTDIGSQKRVLRMMAPSGFMSIKQAVESDTTLGGSAQDLEVTKCSGYKLFIRETTTPGRPGSISGPLLGAEWTVRVLVRGA